MATSVVEKAKDAVKAVEEKIIKIFRWNGIGPIHMPNGSFFHWPVRDPVLVTHDVKIHAKLADVVDGRLLIEIDPNDQDLDEGLLAEIKTAIAHYEAGTTPLSPNLHGGFGKTVAGILNSDNIRATTQRSDTSAVTSAPTSAPASSTPDLKGALDSLANAKL